VDIEDDLIQIGLHVDWFRVVPTLPEGARSSPAPIKSLTESPLQVMESPRDWDLTASNRQMIMVRHQRPRENRPSVPLLHKPKKLDEFQRLVRIGEDLFSTPKPVVDVIDPTLDKYPWLARHLRPQPKLS